MIRSYLYQALSPFRKWTLALPMALFAASSSFPATADFEAVELITPDTLSATCVPTDDGTIGEVCLKENLPWDRDSSGSGTNPWGIALYHMAINLDANGFSGEGTRNYGQVAILPPEAQPESLCEVQCNEFPEECPASCSNHTLSYPYLFLTQEEACTVAYNEDTKEWYCADEPDEPVDSAVVLHSLLRDDAQENEEHSRFLRRRVFQGDESQASTPPGIYELNYWTRAARMSFNQDSLELQESGRCAIAKDSATSPWAGDHGVSLAVYCVKENEEDVDSHDELVSPDILLPVPATKTQWTKKRARFELKESCVALDVAIWMSNRAEAELPFEAQGGEHCGTYLDDVKLELKSAK